MSETAITIGLLALVAVIGLWVGHWKIKGVGLGIGGVLFGGIIVAHFTTQYGIQLDSHTLHFVQEFGLILFIPSASKSVRAFFPLCENQD